MVKVYDWEGYTLTGLSMAVQHMALTQCVLHIQSQSKTNVLENNGSTVLYIQPENLLI